MARCVFLFAFILQATIIYANPDVDKDDLPIDIELKDKTHNEEVKANIATEIDPSDIALASKDKTGNLPGKPTEEELEEIKEMAKIISLAIHNEMAHFLSYAFRDIEEDVDNSLREKRSTDKPIDDSLILKLLKHIKSNNEFQNTAIEKIMSAQEMAVESGLDFTPDSDIFTELAIASSRQIEELSSILNKTFNTENITTEIEFIPINNELIEKSENNTYYNYHVDNSEPQIDMLNTPSSNEYFPDILPYENIPRETSQRPEHHIPIEPQTIKYNFHVPCESQIPPPPFLPPVAPIVPPPTCPIHEHISFSYMPDFFEQLLFPHAEFSHHNPEPIATFIPFEDMVMPFEETLESEPELVGEELEETVSSKVLVNRGDEPGTATVNHVMSYTVSEKSHFKKAPIVELPEQMQYYFFLI